MKNKNIILINLLGNLSVKNKWHIGALYYESLALDCLAATLEKNGYNTQLLSGEVTTAELISIIEETRPIAVAFSIYTFAYKNSLILAEVAKNKAKSLEYELFTIFGGYHVSSLPEEVISKEMVDFAIVGEGDLSICELMNELNGTKNLNNVTGLYYKNNGEITKTSDPKRIPDIDSLPFPKRDKRFILRGKDTRNLSYPPVSEAKNSAVINYSRGCPFSCSFCPSKDLWQRKVTWRSPKLVVDEIESLIKEYNVDTVGFADLTFNADHDKTIEFCNELIKRDLPVHWGCLVRLDLLNEELLVKMAAAKCIKFSVGIESPITSNVNSIKNDYSIGTDKINSILNIINKVGIIIRAFLIIGFPDESKNSLDKYVEAVQHLPVDELRVTIATPFPGTSFWNECRKRHLIPEPVPWEKFTTADPVILHPNLTNEDILHYREKIITSFFFSEHYKGHMRSKLKDFPHYRISWLEHFENLSKLESLKKYNKQFSTLIKFIKDQ